MQTLTRTKHPFLTRSLLASTRGYSISTSTMKQSVADLVASGELKMSAGLQHPDRLYVVKGDITRLAVDAIVNAANERMLGGGGVDGAIHRAAGKSLFDECLKVQPDARGARCPTGEARLTKGGNLPARFVVHTVGPIYISQSPSESARLLMNAYRNSLQVAANAGIESIAFPSISTGVYGYPIQEATKLAIQTVDQGLSDLPQIEQVVFCVFSDKDESVYYKTLQEL